MSKIGQLAIELDELACEKGFESYSQAKAAGCEVKFHNGKVELMEPLELAYIDWQSEKDTVLQYLREDILPWIDQENHANVEKVNKVIEFVERSTM